MISVNSIDNQILSNLNMTKLLSMNIEEIKSFINYIDFIQEHLKCPRIRKLNYFQNSASNQKCRSCS